MNTLLQHIKDNAGITEENNPVINGDSIYLFGLSKEQFAQVRAAAQTASSLGYSAYASDLRVSPIDGTCDVTVRVLLSPEGLLARASVIHQRYFDLLAPIRQAAGSDLEAAKAEAKARLFQLGEQ